GAESEAETDPAPVEVAAHAKQSAGRSTKPRSRFFSPLVMRIASEHDIDLVALTGSGIGGRITRKDVEAAIQQDGARRPTPEREASPARPRPALPAAADGAYTVVPLTVTRKTISDRLTRSNLEAPQAWTLV